MKTKAINHFFQNNIINKLYNAHDEIFVSVFSYLDILVLKVSFI